MIDFFFFESKRDDYYYYLSIVKTRDVCFVNYDDG